MIAVAARLLPSPAEEPDFLGLMCTGRLELRTDSRAASYDDKEPWEGETNVAKPMREETPLGSARKESCCTIQA